MAHACDYFLSFSCLLKMAAASGAMLLGRTVAQLVVRGAIRKPLWFKTLSPLVQQSQQLPFRFCSTEASEEAAAQPEASARESRFKEKPWEYLESEEYIERYGSSAVWSSYRRNHKGQIPPQKTRKTCIRGPKVCGNPCPICRDHNLFLDYRNVKLLEQFICPHSGIIYHPTHTGICMKKYKQLNNAIEEARDKGVSVLYFLGPFPGPFSVQAEAAIILRAQKQLQTPYGSKLLWVTEREQRQSVEMHTKIPRKRYQEEGKLTLNSSRTRLQPLGLLFFTIPFTSFEGQDFSNQHPAVNKTPPSPALQSKSAWYDWYDWQQPPEKKIKVLRRIYKDYLKEDYGPPPLSSSG